MKNDINEKPDLNQDIKDSKELPSDQALEENWFFVPESVSEAFSYTKNHTKH